MFPVVRIRSSAAEAVEYLGTKSKFWYRDGDRLMLFKAEERGTGEDWAEKIACELAAVLGLPHVHYEMAYDLDQQRPGVVCASFTSSRLALAHGNQLLLALDPDYPDTLVWCVVTTGTFPNNSLSVVIPAEAGIQGVNTGFTAMVAIRPSGYRLSPV